MDEFTVRKRLHLAKHRVVADDNIRDLIGRRDKTGINPGPSRIRICECPPDRAIPKPRNFERAFRVDDDTAARTGRSGRANRGFNRHTVGQIQCFHTGIHIVAKPVEDYRTVIEKGVTCENTVFIACGIVCIARECPLMGRCRHAR